MLGHRQMTLDDYVAILKRRKWYIVAPAVLAPILAFVACFFIPSQFTSQTLVLVEPPTVGVDVVKPVMTIDLNQRLATMKEQILSRSRLEPIINELGLYRRDYGRVPMEDLVGRLQSTITVTPIAPMAETQATQLPGFYVKVTFSDARTAQQICAEVTSMFMQQDLEQRQEQSQGTTDFLTKELDDAKAKLDAQDSKLAEFKQHYLGALPENEQTNLNLLLGLNTQLEAATQAVARAQQDKTFAQSMLSQQVAAWQETQSSKNPDTLQKQLADKQSQLAELQSRYTDDYPDVIKMKSQVAELQKQLASAPTPDPSTVDKKPASTMEPAPIQQLRAQIHQYDQTIKQTTQQQEAIQQQIRLYQGRVQLSPVVEEQYKEMTRDYQTALDFYNDLLKKRSQSSMATELERRQEGEQFRVLDSANLPDRPSFPNRPLFTLGGLGGGLAIGLGLALLLEMRDTTLRSERDVEAFLKLPMLAMLPALDVTVGNGAAAKLGNGNGHAPVTAGSESHRGARS
ncbi:MAG: Wzz/FepE/Etk N-terminal domain-containing protein [Candidatus Acidiferrales bacterium]